MIDQSEFGIAIRGELPENASVFEKTSITGIVYEAAWYINTDPDRPHKLSRIIQIIFPNEVIDDARAAEINGHQGHLGRLKQYLRAQLAIFNPEHDEPKHSSPPSVSWIITSEILNG